jgi:hypothetical protein
VQALFYTENFGNKRDEGKMWMASERDTSLRSDTAESAAFIIQNKALSRFQGI